MSGTVVVTKHLTGQKTPPNLVLTLACLAFGLWLVTVTRVWAWGDSGARSGGGGRGLQRGVGVQMDRPLGEQAFIPKRESGGQGSKPPLTQTQLCVWGRPCLIGHIMQFLQLMQGQE